MKRKKTFKLRKTDIKATRLLTKLGMHKNLARTIMYLSHVNECYSYDIIYGTNLRQPEVSIAMKELRQRKWVKDQTNKTTGKGRPLHTYKINKDIIDIIKDFERQKLTEVKHIKSDLSQLKNLVEQNRYSS